MWTSILKSLKNDELETLIKVSIFRFLDTHRRGTNGHKNHANTFCLWKFGNIEKKTYQNDKSKEVIFSNVSSTES